MSCYLHHVPGRIRIRTPSIKGKPAIAQKLEVLLMGLPGIVLVRVNALTGSILLHYDETLINAAEIIHLVSMETGIDLSGAVHPDRYVNESSSKTTEVIVEKISKTVAGLLIGKYLAGSPLALLAAVI